MILHSENNMNVHPIIFGLDIYSYTNRGDRKSSLFSLAVLQDNHLDKYQKLNKRSLFRKIRDIQPDFIALDNIFELAPNALGIVRFLKIIPPRSRLIQVTGNPRTGMEKIPNLVRKHRLQNQLTFIYNSQKMSALETAEVCARLCQMRVGHEIIAFEEDLKISVSKKRKHGRGGWSAPRFERVSKIAVQQTASEVETILQEQGMTWESFEYPGRHVYILEVERDQIAPLSALLKPLNTEAVKVTLDRISKSSLDFQPLDVSLAPSSHSLRNVILGIDPGTTTGIAVVDLTRGKILYLGSKRECGLSEIIRIASKFGKITCVAADVIPIPSSVEKIAKITGAKIKSPSSLVSATVKREYLNNYSDLTIDFGHLNSHERDALFGALKAYNSLKDQTTKIKRILEESNPYLLDYLPEIQRFVLSGYSISNAIELIQEKIKLKEKAVPERDQEQITKPFKQEIESLHIKIDALYEELDKLEKEVNYWRKESKKHVNDSKKWKDKFEQERLRFSRIQHQKINEAVQREVDRIIDENQQIRRQLRQNEEEMEKLKQIKNFWVKGREMPLKVVKSFSDSAIRETEIQYGLNEGDIVLVLDPSGGGSQTALRLIELGVRGIIAPKNAPNFSDQALRQFKANCIPFLQLPMEQFSTINQIHSSDELKIWVYDELYLTDFLVKEEIRKWELKLQEELRKRTRLEHSLEETMRNKIIENESDIERILDDFRAAYITQYREEFDRFRSSSEEEE